jgi:hypothetical protein
MSQLTDKVRSRGYWETAIRPASFVSDRVPYEQLDEIIPSVAVRLRGWPVPYANLGRDELLRGPDWVGQDIDAEMVDHYEAWRFFMSGLFSHLRPISADWRTGAETARIPHGVSSVIEVWEILFYLTELFELAARLALGPAGDDSMVISAKLHKLDDRGLIVGQSNRAEFFQPYVSHVAEIEQSIEVSREKLVAEGRSEAAEMARQFMIRFGWKPSLQQLLDHQRELTEHR